MTSKVPGSNPGGSGSFSSLFRQLTSPTDLFEFVLTFFSLFRQFTSPTDTLNDNIIILFFNWFEGKRQTGKVCRKKKVTVATRTRTRDLRL